MISISVASSAMKTSFFVLGVLAATLYGSWPLPALGWTPQTRDRLCRMKPVVPNVTVRDDGFRECPADFQTKLVDLEDGTTYGACFKVLDGGERTALDCRMSCANLQNGKRTSAADLPIIRSALVQSFASSVIEEAGLSNIYFWLGATDIHAEGNWTWVDGSIVNYSNWARPHPDNDGVCGEHCAEFKPSGRVGPTQRPKPERLVTHDASRLFVTFLILTQLWRDYSCNTLKFCLCGVDVSWPKNMSSLCRFTI